jgi:hypothetical protein
MAWRIARGLFRLWLVLSVLWIGGVGVVTWWTNEGWDWDAFSLAKSQEKNPPPPGFVIDPKPDATGAELEVAPWIVRRDAAVRFGVILALVPPVFLLALGSALVWAFRGFRY